MSYMLKLLLSSWLVGGFAIVFGVRWTFGFKKIISLVSGKRLRWLELLLGIGILAAGLGATFPVTLDYMMNDPVEEIVYVKQRMHSFPSNVVMNSIVTEEHGTFAHMFYEFDVKVNGYYKIKYLPRSEVLIHAEKIN